MKKAIRIRHIQKREQSWARDVIGNHFGSHRVVSRGRLHDTQNLPGLIAIKGNEYIGLLHYHIEGKECEVVTIINLVSGRRVGRKILEAVNAIAREANCERVWLITTNDNLSGQAFYRHLGGEQVAIHRNAIKKARKLKPEIPQFGENGIPINDEIEFEWKLGDEI